MGRILVGVAGAGIGSLFGNAYAGFNIGYAVGSLLFPKKNEIGKLGDFKASGSSYNHTIPYVSGNMRIAGNMIWVGKDANGNALRETVVSTSSKGGGSNKHYGYSASFAMLLCEGEIGSVCRIIAEDTKIYDASYDVPTQFDIQIYTGTEAQFPDSTMEMYEGVGNVPAYRGRAYVVFTDFPLEQWGNRIPNMEFEICGAAQTLGQILTHRLEKSGLNNTEYELSQADTPIYGLLQNERTDVNSFFQPILEAYQTDLVEVDGVIKAVKRNSNTVHTIDFDDLGANQPTRYTITRTQDVELPQILDLGYFDYEHSFNTANVEAIRQTKNYVANSVNVNLPIALTQYDARLIANRVLYSRWSQREAYEFSVPIKYLFLSPADLVYLTINGVQKRLRIESMSLQLFGAINIRAVQDEKDTTLQFYDNELGTVQSGEGAIDYVNYVDTTFDVYSGIEFKDAHATRAGFYVAATGVQGWKGATIYYSPNGGTDWVTAGIVTQRANFGHTWNTLNAYGSIVTVDSSQTLDVHVYETGMLSSTSQVLVDNGENAALVGNEIIGFRTASEYSTDNYHLNHFKRGRRGSPMTSKPSFSKFWHLSNAIKRIPVDDSLIGQTIQVRVVSFGQSLATVTGKNVTIATPNYPYPTQADLEWVLVNVLVNTNYTVDNFPKKTFCIVCNGNNTITLPSATTWKRPIFIRAKSGSITVNRSGSALIEGATSFVMGNSVNSYQPVITQGYGGINAENTRRREVTLLSDGTNWFYVSETFAG